MNSPRWITSPDHPALDELCAALAAAAIPLDDSADWPREQLKLCGEYGVFRWFLPQEWGGLAWSDVDLIRGYLRLSAACLTTTFIITQRTGACQRILASDNQAIKSRLLAGLATGDSFASVGISHLTTSRRHLGRPVLRGEVVDGGYRLDGYSPWVTGAIMADDVVIGATLADGNQILVALPTRLDGVVIPQPPRLVGLSASCTGELRCQNVFVPRECLLAGPDANVMRSGAGAGTGGLQTSTLAIGLAAAAIAYLEKESARRPELGPGGQPELRSRARAGRGRLDLVGLSRIGAAACSNEDLRVRANSLVLRSTQAALAAAKGSGYVVGHPAGRWCREALFFLVWSCPQSVMAANLCELAGIE